LRCIPDLAGTFAAFLTAFSLGRTTVITDNADP
jgi:hypothetical protein